jgi:hypothetical protein
VVSFLLFFRVGWIVSGRCPHLFLLFLLSSSFGWTTVLGNATSGFFGISLPYNRVALGSINAGVVRL